MTRKKTGFFKTFHYLCLVAVLAVGLITIVGSNGGDDGTITTTPGTTTNGGGDETTTVDLTDIGGIIYNTAEAVGDLLQVAFNPTTLEYGFNVIEGINEGQSDTGTLSLMTGYTQYLYETDDGQPVIVFPDNTFIAIPGGGDEGISVGVPSLTTDYTVDDIAGVYNFVEFAGTGGNIDSYEGSYGTFEVKADGTWEAWDEGDLTSDTDIGGNEKTTGTWEDQGNGIVYAKKSNGNKFANVMLHPAYAGSADEKVLIIDICDTENDFRGVMLGVKQMELTSGNLDGTYTMLESDEGDILPISVSGTTVSTPGGDLTITYNSPWNGFMQGGEGTLVLMLPGGIFFGGGGDGDNEWIFAGIKTGS